MSWPRKDCFGSSCNIHCNTYLIASHKNPSYLQLKLVNDGAVSRGERATQAGPIGHLCTTLGYHVTWQSTCMPFNLASLAPSCPNCLFSFQSFCSLLATSIHTIDHEQDMGVARGRAHSPQSLCLVLNLRDSRPRLF